MRWLRRPKSASEAAYLLSRLPRPQQNGLNSRTSTLGNAAKPRQELVAADRVEVVDEQPDAYAAQRRIAQAAQQQAAVSVVVELVVLDVERIAVPAWRAARARRASRCRAASGESRSARDRDSTRARCGPARCPAPARARPASGRSPRDGSMPQPPASSAAMPMAAAVRTGHEPRLQCRSSTASMDRGMYRLLATLLALRSRPGLRRARHRRARAGFLGACRTRRAKCTSFRWPTR